MKEKLCKAFCDDLSVSTVPAGLAVRTTFAGADGDRIGFYVIKTGDTKYRIEDDGVTLPYLEGSGLDFDSGTRGEALQELLREYGVAIDAETREFYIGNLTESQIASAALKFVAFSLRVRDFMLMTEFRVATTFREDAARMIRDAVNGRATIEENVPITPKLADFPADFVLRAPKRRPVGVYLGTSDNRVLEAMVMALRNQHEIHEDCSIVALVEKSRTLSSRVRQQALNRLDGVMEFRGDEVAAVEKIAREAIGRARLQ